MQAFILGILLELELPGEETCRELLALLTRQHTHIILGRIDKVRTRCLVPKMEYSTCKYRSTILDRRGRNNNLLVWASRIS